MLGLAGIVLRETQRMMTELTQRYAQDRILDVTCAVDLAAFDDPDFHDKAARAQAGVMRAPQLVFGLQGLGRSLASGPARRRRCSPWRRCWSRWRCWRWCPAGWRAGGAAARSTGSGR